MRDIRFFRTLFYTDGPQVFEARDSIGGHYVGLMTPEGYGGPLDECLVVGVAPERLAQFRDGAVDLRTLLMQSDPAERYIGTFPDNPDGAFGVKPLEASHIDEALLPSAGFLVGEDLCQVPNIFDYATSELSQDALLCWLVACARCSDERLRRAGYLFVQTLFRHHQALVVTRDRDELQPYRGECRVTEVGEPRKQHAKIDVYFRAKVDGRWVSFVIEDKTGTQMHGHQLRRYRDSIANDSEPEDFIKPIYLKTGFVFDDERAAAEHDGYVVFDGCDMLKFLKGLGTPPHEIVHQFRDYLASEQQKQSEKLDAWDMRAGFVQWRFMMRLREVLDPENETMLPAKGESRGGGAWTQYPHWKCRGVLFWRLDPARQIRLMVKPNMVNQPGDWWGSWSTEFDRLAASEGLKTSASRRRRRHRGKLVAEGTVGTVSLDGLKGNAEEVLERLRRLHWGFLESVGLTDAERSAARMT